MEQRDGGPAVRALCPVSDCWEEDSEDNVSQPTSSVPLSRAESFLSCLHTLRAVAFILSTSRQLLSQGPKISAVRKAVRGTAWWAGPGPAASLDKCLCLWQALEMFTLWGRGGVDTLLVASGPGAGTGRGLHCASTGSPRVCYHHLEALPTAYHIGTLPPQDTAA